jgi:hypothetical protein
LEAQLNRVRQEFLTRPAEQYRDSAFYRGKLQTGLQSLADTAREMTRQDNRQLVEQFGQLGHRKLHIESAPLVEPGFGEHQDDALMMKAG